ncbi:putative tRNA pseudouridine synthase Pus10 [Ochlerotatus camptorhynchus]|uniref:putative tRNA pseudouridine synthase Pus10 n=1 Tax=Ochlerotatus camptorhynchus TaxID=644619 RepID=UPI0031D26559
MSNDSEIYSYLRSVSCCRICCLRYLNGRADDFLNVDEGLKKRDISLNSTDPENPPKRIRENVCVACLGVFESALIDSLLDQIRLSSDFKEYECQGFTSSIFLPIVFHLRQLSLWIGLLEKFPEKFKKDSSAPDVTVKDALKMVLNRKLEEALGKQFSVNGVAINIYFKYEKETQELQLLEKVKPGVFVDRKSRKHCRKEFITRNAFEKHFTPESLDLEQYKKHISVPPTIQDDSIVLEKINFTGPTMFLAGRYNKVSRELSQTPWVLDGKRKMENSVQEIMASVVGPYFRVPENSLIFSSSGREDVDVRCLGEGRPFVLEIPNAFKDYLEGSTAGELEKAIDKSKLISVKDLQLVDREELTHIKHGEENKRKFYRALCVLEKPVTLEVLKALNMDEPFVIDQWTPLRVLHRRPLLSRPRTVHSVKACACKTNERTIVIDVVTQAGTYIKELVHGDFGRTKPSFKSIIGQAIDIHALDVMAIDLDWPKRLRR